MNLNMLDFKNQANTKIVRTQFIEVIAIDKEKKPEFQYHLMLQADVSFIKNNQLKTEIY